MYWPWQWNWVSAWFSKAEELRYHAESGQEAETRSAQQEDLLSLLLQFKQLFPDIPTRTDILHHDVDVGDSPAMKEKIQYMQEKIQYLLDKDFVESSNSDWSSRCILVPKPDGSYLYVQTM